VEPARRPRQTPGQKDRLEDEIPKQGDGPIYIAVLAAAARNEAGGDTTEALRALALEVHRRGAYAVVAGGQFRAVATANTGLGSGEAGKLATKAFDAHQLDGLGATLVDFVDRVGAARSNGGGHRFNWWPVILLAGAGFFVLRAFRRRRAAAVDTAEVKEAAREDLVALADDVQALEHDVDRSPQAKQSYLAALDQYSKASQAFDRART